MLIALKTPHIALMQDAYANQTISFRGSTIINRNMLMQDAYAEPKKNYAVIS